jgi:hypothetical protein
MCERLPQRPGAIAIFPRVGLDARQWDSGRFGQLIAALVKSPDVTEINIYAGKPAELDIIPIPDHPKIHLQCGLRFADLGTSLSGNEICVGNNSFGVHLASYVGCKTIGIYSGHELPQQWGPGFNDAKAVMIDVACAPCHLPSREACNFGMRCLEDISVKTVLDLVKAELRGVDDVTYRSDVVAANPASAVRPLLNDINTARAHGRIAPLQHRQRIAVAAAIEMNFPERDREGSVLFVDMSNFRLDVERPAAKTQKDWSAALALVEGLRRNVPSHFSVTMIAASQHDHEYVAFPSATFEDICAPTTGRKAVRPIAGDVYLGIDSYLFRNSAQWDLLYDWRHLGVTTSFLLPTLDLDVWNYGAGESEHAALVDGFLRRVTHLDLLVTADERHARLDQWALDVMPPRERLLRVGHAWGAAAEQRRGGAHPTAPVGTWDDLRVRQLAQLLTGGREAEQSPARPARKPATAL